MKNPFKQALAAISLGAMTLTGLAATPALAQPGRDAREWRQERREDRRDHRADRRDDRRDNRRNMRRPGRVVYNYDWNRPDPRYGRRYRPDRYYRDGYEPIRVTRNTRIYRGFDNRYYCRRSDGTTGLIVGAALGGLLGSQLDQGASNLAGVLIGGGAGALLGREIDRGNLSCR